MRKILLASILLVSSINAFAYGSSETRQNWDGSTTTRYSDGTSSETRRNWDNSATTTFSDGTRAESRRNWDGSISTNYSN